FAPPYLVAACGDNRIRVYVFAEGKRHGAEEGGVKEMAGGVSGVETWSVKRKRNRKLIHVATLYAHTAAVTAVDVDSHGKMITCGLDGIKIWELPNLSSIGGRRGEVKGKGKAAEHETSTQSDSDWGVNETDVEWLMRTMPEEPVVTMPVGKDREEKEQAPDEPAHQNMVAWVGFDEGKIVGVRSNGGGSGAGGRAAMNGGVRIFSFFEE
ncbi:hypothetical protein HK097_009282, partial [Rhizophlyctis rosea]